MTEETPPLTDIDGHQVNLPDGRYVWAGRIETGTALKFRNKEGQERWVFLSAEATDALLLLLQQLQMQQHAIAMVVQVNDDIKEMERLEWRAVEPPKVEP